MAKLAPKRIAVARRNLTLCYPDWTKQKVEETLKLNIERTGMAVFETAMGWWWPDWRVKRISKVEGLEYAESALKQGRGVFGLALHNVNLELGCRIMGLYHPSIAFYRKHDNKLMDFLQYRGRSRSNKYMIHKRNSKALVEALNSNELCLYLPDQDYGRAQSAFVPFGGVEQTATTKATAMFIERSNCETMIVTSQFTKSGYKVKFYPPIHYFADNNVEQALTLLNQDILNVVGEQLESYLWMHKRFKTRALPEHKSLYD